MLKGAAVAAAAWDEPSARPTSDVDVLVGPDELDRAVKLLLESGLAERAVQAKSEHHHLALRAAGPAGLTTRGAPCTEHRPAPESQAEELLKRRITL